MRRGLALLALLLLLAPTSASQGPDARLRVLRDHVALEVVGTHAQVDEKLIVEGNGTRLELRTPAAATGVQAFLLLGYDFEFLPWSWAEPGLLSIQLPGAGAEPRRHEVEVRYVFPAGVTGFAFDLAPTLPTDQLELSLALPEGWQARVDGAPSATQRTWTDGAPHTLLAGPVAGPSPLVTLAALLALVFVLTMARAVSARGKPVKQEMRLLDHLAELQGRLRNILLAVAALMLFLFSFALQPMRLGGLELVVPVPSLTDNIAAQTFRLLAQQFVPLGVQLIVVDPISAALVQVEVALFLALLVASPLIGYEVGAFLMPALLSRERRLLLKSIPAATLLFVAGAAFAYAFMIPLMMRVLYSYAQGLGAVPFIAVDSLVSFAVVVTLIFGLAFELPIGMVALAKLGLVSPRTMAQKWRHVVVVLFVLAAVITPDPSVVSQLLVALPLCALYVLGLVAARAATRDAAAPSKAASPSAP